jgi:hypothetical protein
MEVKLSFHTTKARIDGRIERFTMNFQTIAIWKAITLRSIERGKKEQKDDQYAGYSVEEIIDMLESQLQRLKIAEIELDRFGERTGKLGIVTNVTAPLNSNYECNYEELNRLIVLETESEAKNRRRNLRSVHPKGDIIVNGGPNIYHKLSKNGRRKIVTLISPKQGHDPHEINLTLSKMLKYCLMERDFELREMILEKGQIFIEYAKEVFPILIETMSEQYSRAGYRICHLFNICHLIMGYSIGLLPEFRANNVHPDILKAPACWLTSFLIEMDRIIKDPILTQRLTRTTTKLPRHRDGSDDVLNKRLRTINTLYLADCCRTCFGDSKGACGGCRGIRYCSIKCQKTDWEGHKLECKEMKQIQKESKDC